MRLMKLSALRALALTLAGRGTTSPASVTGVSGIMGPSLAGVRGVTPVDQERIDIAQARGKAARLWSN